MKEIRAMEIKGNILILVCKDGSWFYFNSAKNPGVTYIDNGNTMPVYDEKTNRFVCGSDMADEILRELLATTLLCGGKAVPRFLTEDPLVAEVIAGVEADYRRVANSFGLKADAVAQAA